MCITYQLPYVLSPRCDVYSVLFFYVFNVVQRLTQRELLKILASPSSAYCINVNVTVPAISLKL